jgi:hypothetical protein
VQAQHAGVEGGVPRQKQKHVVTGHNATGHAVTTVTVTQLSLQLRSKQTPRRIAVTKVTASLRGSLWVSRHTVTMQGSTRYITITVRIRIRESCGFGAVAPAANASLGRPDGRRDACILLARCSEASAAMRLIVVRALVRMSSRKLVPDIVGASLGGSRSFRTGKTEGHGRG